jgi:hypothetical protein
VTGAESTGHLDVGPDEASDAAPRTFTVEVGDSGATVNVGLTLQPFDATVSGTVFLVTGDDDASVSAQSDIAVVATSGDVTRTATSGLDGKYTILISSDRLWQITTATVGFNGTTGSANPGSGGTDTVNIQLAANVRDIGGNVTGLTSGDVTISASANGYQTVTQVLSVNGSGTTPYNFSSLNTAVTWTITFSDGSVTVSRFVAPNGDTPITDLNQDLAAADTADIVVNLTDLAEDGLRTDPLEVTVTLSDIQAFPRIAAPIVHTLTLGAGVTTSVVTFDGLVTTSGSPPFTIVVAAGDYKSVTVNDAVPGVTEEISLIPEGRQVVLTLTEASDGSSISGVTANLVQVAGGTTVEGTPPEGSNVYTFDPVTPGSWELRVEGYLPFSVNVPIGPAATAVQIDAPLVESFKEVVFVFGGVTSSALPIEVGATLSVTVNLLDGNGDIAPIRQMFTLTSADIATVSASPASGELAGGETVIEVAGIAAGETKVTFTAGGKAGVLTVTVTGPAGEP